MAVDINKMKRQPTEWEKIFANNATNKRLISKTFKQHTLLTHTYHTHTPDTYLPHTHHKHILHTTTHTP